MRNFDPSLYFITDSTGFTEEEFLYRVEQALIGGATMLQLREKEKTNIWSLLSRCMRSRRSSMCRY